MLVNHRLGLGYEVLRELNPAIILLSSSGLGRTGPEKEVVAYGNNLHAYSGLTSMVGYERGRPRGTGGTWADPLTGITAAYAILAALHYRKRTGRGQFIDLSMTEATLAQLPEAVLDYTVSGKVRGTSGNRDDVFAPQNCYPCTGYDKWVAISVENDEQFRALCSVIGRPDLADDVRFSDGFARWTNQDELDPIIGEWTRGRSHYEATAALQAAGVPAGPSVNAAELVNDPHMLERGLYAIVDHPEVGKTHGYKLSWRFENGPSLKFTRAPLLGEHNDKVLQDLLHLSPEEIQRLKDESVIY
ncbi:MAG: CoA transferase [Chloroflexi bacterium]|nr:CoA transferase [Chloroflexota bacterium]